MTLAVEQAKADKQLFWLFEAELTYRIEGETWTQADAPNASCWYMNHLTEGMPSRVRQMLRSTHAITTYTERPTLALCQANAGSWFHEDSNLVLNGGFDSGTAEWTPTSCTIASIAGGQSGNCLEMTRVSENYQILGQICYDLVPGIKYKISCYVKSGTSGDEAFILEAGRPFAMVNHYCQTSGTTEHIDGISSGAWTEYSFEFTAGATWYVVNLYKMTATPGTMLFDTVSVKRSVPAGRLYVHTSGSDAPDTASKYYLSSHFWKYFSTHQYPDPNTLYDPAGLFIEPRLGKVPSDLTQEVKDFSEVGIQQTWGDVEIANPDGKYDAQLVTYIWHMCPFLLKVGAPGDAYANLVTILRGRTGSIKEWTDEKFKIGVEDQIRTEE